MNGVMLAGALEDLGDGFIAMLSGWGDDGLQAVLVAIVAITALRTLSMKSAIGAILLFVVALGIYRSQDSLSDAFEDEVNNPAKAAASAPALPGPGGGA
ncbi:hypothetical protein ACIPPN_26740 [Streptomyces diastaticus]|uniref:Uncharacterized protein n=1 Tax=Streptomyces diastaticus subsp. diastaticus TaxID=68040 RepID=A0ABQ1CRV3_STRDI|nr:hypothetical protein [Streptomyces diastaticus]GFH72873.1 hypothetical protein Sdia_36410 [Streptomyces diastaticus subsp. diastaticus]GGU45318.1 hypothetical protein GCM10015534_54860 [Streptomyces diastaticus subsp. diastaticus]